jgi:sulfur relay (sulfurtransferase) DsrF/TusC family protein
MLRDFGVSKFYVHDESLTERGLTTENLVMDVEVVNGAQIAEIMQTAGKVLPF